MQKKRAEKKSARSMQEAKAKLTLAGTAVVAVVPSALAPVGIVPAFKVTVPAVLVVRAPVAAFP